MEAIDDWKKSWELGSPGAGVWKFGCTVPPYWNPLQRAFRCVARLAVMDSRPSALCLRSRRADTKVEFRETRLQSVNQTLMGNWQAATYHNVANVHRCSFKHKATCPTHAQCRLQQLKWLELQALVAITIVILWMRLFIFTPSIFHSKSSESAFSNDLVHVISFHRETPSLLHIATFRVAIILNSDGLNYLNPLAHWKVERSSFPLFYHEHLEH